MRKKLALAVLTGLLAASLTGCMPSAAPSSAAGAAAQTEKQGQPSETGGKEGTSEESEGEATIRMNWWGGDSRHEATLKGIHAFEELHPNIHVEPEYEAYSGHQEKIALALNSKVAADVLQMNMNWIFDYSPKGDTFLDLNTVSDVLDLNGPVCPVYGFGVLSVFALLNTIQGSGRQMSDGMIFVFGIVLATAVELVAGWLLDVCFHARWWDYSDKPFNFHGYICLEFSLIWGLAIVMVVKVFQKYVEAHALHTPATWEWIVIAVLYAVYLTDFIVTVAVIQGLNKKLTRLDKVRSDLRIVSDKLSDTLATTTIGTAQKVGEGKVQATLAAAELRDATAAQREKSIEMLRIKRAELQAQFEELSSSITNHTVVGQGRIIKAFPKMQHRDYSELIQELKKRLK